MAIRDAVLTKDASLDSAPLASAFEALWAETQEPFFEALLRAAETAGRRRRLPTPRWPAKPKAGALGCTPSHSGCSM